MVAKHQHGDEFAAPSAPQEAEIAWGLGGDPGDGQRQPTGAKAKGPTGLVPGHDLDAFAVKSLDPSVDGPGATEQQGDDVLPGVASVQEQQDVGSEPDLGIGDPYDIG